MLRILLVSIIVLMSHAVLANPDNFGETIQINTNLSSIKNNPSWLIEIRDLEHNQTIPYLLTINKPNQQFLLYTYSHDYVILASRLQFQRYTHSQNTFTQSRLSNFCQLESRGRIQRFASYTIELSGTLSPYTHTYECRRYRYQNTPPF